MLEHGQHVPRPDSGAGPLQRLDLHLVDQVSQKRRLPQQLHLREVRGRLQGDRRQFLPPVRMARAKWVARRHCHQHPPGQSPEPPPHPLSPRHTGPPISMVRPVERLEHSLQVGLPPRRPGPAHQHDRQSRPLRRPHQVGPNRPAPGTRRLQFDQLRLPPPPSDHRRQLGSPLPPVRVQHQNRYPGPVQRRPLEVSLQRVHQLVFLPRSWLAHAPSSQSPSARRKAA